MQRILYLSVAHRTREPPGRIPGRHSVQPTSSLSNVAGAMGDE